MRWHTRSQVRKLTFQVLHTLHGKFGFLGVGVLLVMFAPITIRGVFESLPKTRVGLDGLLLVGHLWLAATLSLMILAQLANGFLKNPEREPLTAHPAHLPVLAQHRVLAAIPHTTLGFAGLFFSYFWQPLAARLDRPLLSFPVHLFTTSLLAISSGVAFGLLGRSLLSRAMRRRFRNTDLVVNICGGTALSVFVVLLISIVIANRYAVSILEALGNSVAVSISIGMIPFAAALAADEGRWLALAGWLGVSAAAASWAIRATYRWSFSAHREIPIDLATPTRRVFAPVFTGQPRRWLMPGLCAFWRKDIVVPYSREPKRYLFHQASLLLWGIMSVMLATTLRNRGTIGAAFANTMPVLMTLVAMAVVAMQNGVNALGREGEELTWLHPIFSAPQLLSRKSLINLAYVLVHGVVYALSLSAASTAVSLDAPFWILLAYALGAGGVFACLATAVGFLLPDFERRRSSLPGSTTFGKMGYLFAAFLLTVMTGTAHLLLTAGSLDGSTYAGLLAFVGIGAAIGTALIAAGALRQYQGMEI